ncbi:MAG: hypothetical protein HUJ54_13320 [Erysipelotrichaceae bacterium]|nr:hypothetical protein [Erysipelotrichaceae bacterium]
MLRLFNADMNRTLRSPAFWFFCLAGAAIAVLLILFTVPQVNETGPVAWVKAEGGMISAVANMWLLQVGLFSLFSQDFKSKIHQAAIGNGISRAKIVLAKYLETIAVSAICLMVIYGAATAVRLLNGVSLTGPQEMDVFLHVLSTLVHLSGLFAVLMLPLFLFQNLAVSALIGLVLGFDMISSLLRIIQDALNADLLKYEFVHNLQMVTNGVTTGNIAVFPIIMVFVYAAVCIGLGILFFQKKELEF